jgi:hypothetical protein
LCTVNGNAKWCRIHGKYFGGFSKKIKIELSHDPEILLLGRRKKEMKAGTQRGICIAMFIITLFTIVRR